MRLKIFSLLFSISGGLLILIVWPALENNLCRLCELNFSSQQTDSCNDLVPKNHFFCHLCRSFTYDIVNYNEKAEAITVHAQQMQANPKFLYKRQQFSETELLMHNAELNIDFPILVSEIPAFDFKSETPLVSSAIDDELIPFDGFLRLWWDDVVTATVPITPADYQLEIYALNDIPGPVAIRVLVSGKQLGFIQWDHDDQSWSSKCIYLPAEYFSKNRRTVITLEYFNDGTTVQGDRDAAIAWIRLVPINKP